MPARTVLRQRDARRDLSQALVQLELGLREERDWSELQRLFPQAWESRPDVGDQVQRLRKELALLAQDGADVPFLRQYLKALRSQNAESLAVELHRRLQTVATEALREPLSAEHRALMKRIERARREARRVQGLATGADPQVAFDAARKLVQDYPDVPSALDQVSLTVEIRSNPPGALVRWRGDSMQFRTPFEVEVPLIETRQLELDREGYKPYRAQINLQTLDSPRPVFELTPGQEERE
ncbi:MAG: PEGA domain-containing protein [Planctomycetota bacterium]